MIIVAASGVNWDQLRQTLISIDITLAISAVVVLIGMYVIYSLRWAFILPTERRLKFSDVYSAVMIGYLVNTVTPLRLGDIARSTFLSRSSGVPIGRSMGSIFAEHLYDAVLLVIVIVAFTPFISVPPIAKTAIFIGAGVAVTASVLVMLLAPARFEHFEALARKLGRLGERVFGVAMEFNLGFDSIRQGHRVLGGVVWTLLTWMCIFGYAILLAQALDLDVPWYAPIFALALAGLGSAIPGTPAAIGVFQLAIVAGLSVWTKDPTSSLAYAFAVHAGQLILNIIVGGIVAVRTGYLSSHKQLDQHS